MNKYLTTEDVLQLKEIDGWNVYECEMSGTVEWYDGSGTFIYATPNWETDGVTPFAIFTEESGEYETVKELITEPNSSIQSQLNSYIKTLKNVIKVI